MKQTRTRNLVAFLLSIFVLQMLSTAQANDEPDALRARLETIPLLSALTVELVDGERIQGTLADVSDIELALWIEADDTDSAMVPVGGKLKRHIPYDHVRRLHAQDDLLSDAYVSEFEEDLRFQGYFFGGPAWFNNVGTLFVLGGGFDWLVYEGFGVGLEGSVLGDSFSSFQKGSDFSIGTAGINVSYHFLPDSPGIEPFVVGGISGGVSAQYDVSTWASVGGGFNYWFDNGMALRVEVRGRFDVDDDDRVVGLRIGLTF